MSRRLHRSILSVVVFLTLCSLAFPYSGGSGGESILIPAQSEWLYFKGTQEPGSGPSSDSWRLPDFDPQHILGWMEGPTPIGYDNKGTPVMGTPLGDMFGNYTTIYLLMQFTIDDPAKISRLALTAQYDDGFNAWINGTYVAYANVKGELLPFNECAPAGREDNNFVTFIAPTPLSYLRPGHNVIAVQVFNTALYLNSSDCFFDGILSATVGQDAIEISTVADWQELMATSADWSKQFILTADLDLAGVTLTPVGNYSAPFTGSLDGNGHTIRNARIDQSGSDYIGLFGYLASAARIQNLRLWNPWMSGRDKVGGLAGYSEATVTNCSVDSGTAYGYWTGGEDSGGTGGLVGFADHGSITSCSSTGSVTGAQSVGGLVGYIHQCAIQSCYSAGWASAADAVGGLVGWNENGWIDSSYSTSGASGGETIGGLVGYMRWGTARHCYSAGSVSGDWYVGGFLGYSGWWEGNQIDSCYSVSHVSAENDFGGLVGSGTTTVTASFWDIEASGQTDGTYGGIGKTTADMKNPDTFLSAGWYSSDWVMQAGKYPVLPWQTFEVPSFIGMTKDQATAAIVAAGFTVGQLNYQQDSAIPNDTVINQDPPVLTKLRYGSPISLWISQQTAGYSGGAGTQEDPYQIASITDFQQLMSSSGDWKWAFILTADIDLTGNTFDRAPIAPDTDDAQWDFQGTQFTGFFNGNGHSISNLTIVSVVGSDFLGLFGSTTNAHIENLSVNNVSISASGSASIYVGALIGFQNFGLTQNCSSSGAITVGNDSQTTGGLIGYCHSSYNQSLAITRCSSSVAVAGIYYVGGLVGDQWNCTLRECSSSGSAIGDGNVGGLTGFLAGIVERSFSTASVSCTLNGNGVGGLVGQASGSSIDNSYARGPVVVPGFNSYVGGLAGVISNSTLTHCYSSGLVQSIGFSSNVGGFIGNNNGSVVASFWDTESSAMTDASGAAGRTTAEMKTLDTFLSAGWDFADESTDGTPAVWKMTAGNYPTLAWEPSSQSKYSGGTGESSNPWQIATVDDLILLGQSPTDWTRSFVLTADIDLAGNSFSTALIAPDTDPDTQGFQGMPFTGNFDGNYHTIAKLSIVDNTGADFLGLFGQIGAGGQVRNLILANASISASGYGNEEIGLLAGAAISGSIAQCGVGGSIDVTWNSDNMSIGGLVGWQNSGSITQSYSSARVSGGFTVVGGLVGLLDQGMLTDCYASGLVEGYYNLGGLVGHNSSGVIDKGFSVGRISCFSGGGLVGGSSGTTTNSFWDYQTSMQWNSAGGTGQSTWDMQNRWLFESAGWDFSDESFGGNPAVWRIREGQDYPRLAWQPLVPGDIAGSPTVDQADLVALADAWAQSDCSSGCPADLNGDGKVDLSDFAILAAHWLEGI